MIDIQETLALFPFDAGLNSLDDRIGCLRNEAQKYTDDVEVLQTMFNCIDLTTLSECDSSRSVSAFVDRVNTFAAVYPKLKNVGGICVYSNFAPILKEVLKVDSVHRAVVAACFPSSQAFADIKCAEVRKAVYTGATEVDVVISIGEMLDGNYQTVFEELCAIREACGAARLKVIIESGTLKSRELIYKASIIAMEAGADFIKTSTGKNGPGASPEAAYVMCGAIKAYCAKRGRKVGFKPAGGVATPDDAALYYTIVRSLLGTEWLVNTRFRIGASRLANSLLCRILRLQGEPECDKFF